MDDQQQGFESARERHERRAGAMRGARDPEYVVQRTRQFWQGAFPDQSQNFIARLLGIGAGGSAGWWIHENRFDSEWWEIGLAALLVGIATSWFFSKFPRLTNLTATIIFIGVAVWFAQRMGLI